MAPPSRAHLESIIYDVFLPTKLPSRSRGQNHENDLVSSVISSLRQFCSYLHRGDGRDMVLVATQMIDNFTKARNKFGGIHQERLEELLLELASDSSFILPLHVKAQNAAIIIRGTVFEVFELTPPNRTVMETVGRVRRSFPSLSVTVTPEVFASSDFQKSTAATISKMSDQFVPEITSGHPDDETTNPILVTDLLFSFLLSNGRSTAGAVIWKNTRDEISVSNSKSRPWKRSSVWLLLRVALHSTMSTAHEGAQSDQVYKKWMVFHMAQLLGAATAARLQTDVIACMSAKLARRLVKLGLTEHETWVTRVSEHMTSATELLEARWRDTIEAHTQLLGFTRLAAPGVEDDTRFHLPELDSFLRSIADRQHADTRTLFRPKSQMLLFSAGQLPAIESIKGGTYQVQNLYAFEEWVSENLDTWTQQNAKDPQACSRLEHAIQSYHQVARTTYKGSPDTTSAMLLTLLELWISCDRIAVAIHPLLSQYDHEIPIDSFQSLLLRFKGDMERLFRAERYLKSRSNSVTRRTERSAVFGFGADRCFSAEFAADSTEHQDILTRIGEQAEEAKKRKFEELEVLRSEYNTHMELHSQSCVRCQAKAAADSLAIEVYEWPLPMIKAERLSVVFELAVPPAFRAWRDASIFLVSDVLGHKPRRPADVRPQCMLERFEGLYEHYRRESTDQRVKVASETMPSKASRQPIQIGSEMHDGVCVASDMHWRLVDSSATAFLGQFTATAEVSKACTVQLASSTSLQPFLSRSVLNGHGQRPNAVIAQQSACPENMSIGEYKALCALPYSYHTQWMNVLVQLAMPSVD
ncbi:hypothetical protein G6O67_003270 [Ophiocordyceps sinensis]|uniref:DUF6606 domain-containing protein n=2 Tax=Ophiocordyceps sinensis TaxID=72228 RepID=A0A8H4V8F5_9HYPO|nr:hypothetical protein G6O67_003270 [Ophiocordyceps sinensis]